MPGSARHQPCGTPITSCRHCISTASMSPVDRSGARCHASAELDATRIGPVASQRTSPAYKTVRRTTANGLFVLLRSRIATTAAFEYLPVWHVLAEDVAVKITHA